MLGPYYYQLKTAQRLEFENSIIWNFFQTTSSKRDRARSKNPAWTESTGDYCNDSTSSSTLYPPLRIQFYFNVSSFLLSFCLNLPPLPPPRLYCRLHSRAISIRTSYCFTLSAIFCCRGSLRCRRITPPLHYKRDGKKRRTSRRWGQHKSGRGSDTRLGNNSWAAESRRRRT